MRLRRRRQPSEEENNAAIAAEVRALAPVVARYRGDLPEFGAPTRCPDCESFGMVTEMIAAPVVSTANSCPSCGATWTISRRALRGVTRYGSVEGALAQLGIAPVPALGSTPSAPLVGVGSGMAPQALARAVDVTVANGPLSLLLVEDDPADAALVEAILEPVADEIDLRQAWSRGEGEKLSSDPSLDLVLLDLGLPDSSGLTTLTRWAPRREIPLMVLSGNDNGGLVDASYEYGVRRFVHKQGLGELLDAGREGSRRMVDLIRETAAVVASAPEIVASAAPEIATTTAPEPIGAVSPRITWSS